MDRERLNRTIMYDQYIMHHSYFEDLYDAQHPCTNFYYKFDKERARALLAEAGWKPNPQTGILEKDGGKLKFGFTFMARDASENKFLVIYQQDLKDCGIEMKIELKDWSAWMKEMDNFNFDMTWCSFSGAVFKDPESLWYSREGERTAGNNYPGLKDPKVDELVEKCRSEFDANKRNELLRQLDSILIDQSPYALLWTINYQRIAYWNKFGMPPHILGSVTDERGALQYWWYDPDAAADLKECRASGLSMPKQPFAVDFEEALKK
jgi:microcin C transport system substrate-binding protein